LNLESNPFLFLGIQCADLWGTDFAFVGQEKRGKGISLDMANSFESDDSCSKNPAKQPAPGWVQVGTIAAASALAGGLAAAWWYRKTLAKLNQAEEKPLDPDFGIQEDDPEDG
jgi:hypothetical protein